MRTHDPKFLNDWLFVCKANLHRSATAEHVARCMGLRADSCGSVEVISIRPLTLDQIEHAKNLVCMEESHAKALREIAPHRMPQVWNIPDNYKYNQPELVALIRAKLEGRA